MFARASGFGLTIDYDPANTLKRTIEDGASFDVVIVTRPVTDDLALQGKVRRETCTDIAWSGLGVAVRQGAAEPDIATVDAFRRALPAVRSLVRPKEGTSGLYFETVLDRLGITDAMRDKIVLGPSGHIAEWSHAEKQRWPCKNPHATNSAYQTKNGLVMLGASNLRQQRRLWTLLERPDMIKKTNEERDADRAHETQVLSGIMLMRTADEWENFLQAHHVPAARVRTMGEAVADSQLASRKIIHHHAGGNGVDGDFGVPLAAFTFAHGGPRIDTPPPALGQHNEEIFKELGLS
jgi:hypothetical protein